jgi:SAM-dependent methyltransferase
MSTYKRYSDWTTWWPLVHPPEGCAEEAAAFCHLLHDLHPRPVPDQPQTMVEFGCGGGGNASYLKTNFTMTLVDLSPQMLAISRDLNPECEHLLGDMRTVRLGRQFDVVFIHDAIMYMTTASDLRQALATAYCHCKPGGVALFYLSGVRKTFQLSCEVLFVTELIELGQENFAPQS